MKQVPIKLGPLALLLTVLPVSALAAFAERRLRYAQFGNR